MPYCHPEIMINVFNSGNVRLFNKNSIGDKDTLKVLINRQNIPKKVKHDPNAVEDFIDVDS